LTILVSRLFLLDIQHWLVKKPEEQAAPEAWLRFSKEAATTSFNNFMGQRLPLHVDFSGAVAQAMGFISDNKSEPSLLSLMDTPGIGKTSTIHVASKLAGALYARFSLGNGLFARVHKAMKKVCATEPLKVSAVLDKMKDIALAGLGHAYRAMLQTFEKTKQLELGTIALNGFRYDTDEDAAESLNVALTNLEEHLQQALPDQQPQITVHLGKYIQATSAH